MGRRGPARQPTNLRLLHGETRPSRINRDEPKPRDMAPAKPEWLSGAAAEEWDRIMPDVIVMATARAVDASALGAYCEAVARFRTASQIVAHAGLLIKDRDGDLRRNPAVAQARDASAEMRAWAREFGFTPAARQPLKIEHSLSGLAAERLLT